MDPITALNHGVIASISRTDRTRVAKILVEGFSSIGVPVICVDFSGDLSGVGKPADSEPQSGDGEETSATVPTPRGFPCRVWDPLGRSGIPMRTTVSDLGPVLLSVLLGLDGKSQPPLDAAFTVADQNGLLMLDLKDLRSMIAFQEQQQTGTSEYYDVTDGAIQKAITMFEINGGDAFFGEPALNVPDLQELDQEGYGYVNIIAAKQYLGDPALSTGFSLALLSELFEELPAIDSYEKPRLAVFLDEAQLLFKVRPDVLTRFEEAVRLIGAKGVGLFFIADTAAEVPSSLVGNTFAIGSSDDGEEVPTQSADTVQSPQPSTSRSGLLTSISSVNEADGFSGEIELAHPRSRSEGLTAEELKDLLAIDPMEKKYRSVLDRPSAYEFLRSRAWTSLEEVRTKDSASSMGGSVLIGTVTDVRDGDSFTLRTSVDLKVRLYGVDAPELGQPHSAEAKEYLASLIFGKEVAVEIRGGGMYERVLGRVTVGGHDVSRQLILAGVAWCSKECSNHDVDLFAAQDEARTAGRGLWARPIPPWEYRSAEKKSEQALRKAHSSPELGYGYSEPAEDIYDGQVEGRGSDRDSTGEILAKSVLRGMGGQISRAIVRGVLGNIFKGRR